ncbi:MAG: NB-ARC domain-containing protein [Cyanobacteria bacterium J06621_15]
MAQAHSGSKRYRGFVLTHKGLQKLNNCIQKLEAQTRMRYGASAIARKVQLVESDGIHPITVRKILQCQTGVDYRSIDHVFQALQLSLSEGDYAHADLCKSTTSSQSQWTNSSSPNYINIPDISNFYGRAEEIAQLESKIIYDRTKVVAISGMLGIGKTATAIKLTNLLKNRFDFVIWKSLRQAPTLKELLISVLKQFPTNSLNKSYLHVSLCSLIDLFLNKLQSHRCLLIFDGFETVMNNQNFGKTAYADFFNILLESNHQSNVIITSRIKPYLCGILEDKNLYSMQLNSLQVEDIKKIFYQRGIHRGSQEYWVHLVDYYGGNPLALKTVSDHILQYFEGDVAKYLKELTFSKFILQDFQRLLIEEFKNLSRLEKIVIQKLASYTLMVSLLQLRQDLNEPKIAPYLLNILDYLNSRALIEQHGAYFTVRPFIAECIFHLNQL